MSSTPLDVVYIQSPGHTGSTLLNICLDMHPELVGVSEIKVLNSKRPGYANQERVADLPFWSEVGRDYHHTTGRSFDTVPFSFEHNEQVKVYKNESARDNRDALASILRVSGARIIVDASKSFRRLRGLAASDMFRLKVICLRRNKIAVIHSYQRKYGNIRKGLSTINNFEKGMKGLRYDFPKLDILDATYEDFMDDPEKTLRTICDFIGVSFFDGMLKPDSSVFNGLGGNRMRRQPIPGFRRDDTWHDFARSPAGNFARMMLFANSLKRAIF